MTRDQAEAPSVQTVRLAQVGRWVCFAGGVLGALGLMGWIWGPKILTTLFPGQAPMMPNTALALVFLGFAGAALCAESRSWVRALAFLAAGLVAVVSTLAVIEFASGADLGLDRFLLHIDHGQNSGRPSPPTASALVLLGLAILLFDIRPNSAARPSDWLLIGACIAAVVGVTGQLLGGSPLYRLPRTPMVGVAVPTAVGLLLIANGLLLARPTSGIAKLFWSHGSGGMLLRRLTLPTILVPLLIGFIGVRLSAVVRLDDFPILAAALAVAEIIVGLLLLTFTAVLLNRSYEALLASEAQTRDVVAHASDGIFIAEMNGRYTEVNAAGGALLGMSPSEIIGRNVTDFIRPDEIDRLESARRQLRLGGTQISEWHLRHRAGHYIPVEVSATILPSGLWQGLVRDISRRKAAEEQAKQAMSEQLKLQQELREARSFLENVLQSSLEYGLIALDLDRRILFWNEGARRLFGYTSDEVVGERADILHVERDMRSGVAPALYARALEQGSAEATVPRRRKNGSEFLSRVVVSRRTGSDSAPTGFLLVSRDVTAEQRDAERDRLLAATGLLLTSSLERDLLVEGAAHLLVQDFADACLIDIADRPEAESTGWMSRVVHRDSRKKQLTTDLEALRRDGHLPYFATAALEARRTTVVSHVTEEFIDRLARSDSHRRLIRELGPVSLVSVPLEARGLLLGAITFVSSDPKRRYDDADGSFVQEIGRRLALAVDNARLYTSAQRALAARDDVLRVVAHDLRNPIATILLQVSSLRMDGATDETTVPRRSAAIERAARRMLRLIQDLLDAVKLEAGQLSIQPSVLSARNVIVEALEAQRDLATNASLTLNVDVPDDLPPVCADRDRVLQVIENLVSNAIKFTQAGGTVTVGATSQNSTVVFWVKDTGRGISAEDLPHVFERFWQARGEGTGKSSGVGLGLAIVKGLVEAQGGRVWAESAPGHGSKFYFSLPTKRESPKKRRRYRIGSPSSRSSSRKASS